MHGAPGAGKTCSQHLLLNEPPPEELTDSTPIACPAVQATRISIDDENKKWERVNREDLYKQLASHLKEKTKPEKMSTEVDEASTSDDDDTSDSSDESSMEESTAIESPTNEPTKNERPENEPTKNERPENEPTKSKPAEKKPIETEVIQKVRNVQKTSNATKFSTNWVYFIDSGGQPAYRELLPLFTRAAALNIITIDLTKGLDEKCKFQYRIDQHTSPINTDLQYSNRGIIKSTISSEAMLKSIEIPYVSDMPKHSHYLILGTRKELVTEEMLKKMNESLIEYKANGKVIPRNMSQIIFPVNTLLPAGSKREEASLELCRAISNCGIEMTIKLPIRLFAFEIALQLEAEKKTRSFLTREEVIKIGKSLQLDDESDINKKSDIDEALKYLHNVTIILYYHDVLPKLIFVDPKPILDILSRLIAITYVDLKDRHLIANPPPSQDKTRDLIDRGLFKEDLFKIIGKEKNF